MAETIDLVYVGNKPEKKDTICGTDLIFPVGQPVPVTADIALRLLKHKTVWVRSDEYAKVKGEQERLQREEQAKAAAAEQKRLEELKQASLVVEGYGDLGKLTSVKLKTIVESEELDLEVATGEKVADFAIRVRDALNAKRGE